MFRRPAATLAIVILGLASLPPGASAQQQQRQQQDIRHFNPPGATAPYSAAVRVGDVIYFSGQVGVAADGSVPTDIPAQAKLAMDRVANVARLAGVTMDDIFKCTVMMTDIGQLAAFNSVYVSYFTPGRLPARSALGAPALALKAGVEVECIARAPG
ncbi:RidA family protein [Sphingobium aquiterrae]|uniref:RidA family protein n=1 Tax=Sphingobium aquiterrae TaxID=2038656 RepID=UPI0030169C13